MLFDQGEKMRKGFAVRNDDGFAEQRAAFGSADIEGVAEPAEIRQRDVVFGAGEGVGQSGAVQIERHLKGPADPADFLKLPQAVQRSVFRGMGEVDHAGHHHMLPVPVLPPGLRAGPDLFRRDFSVPVRQGEHLVAAVLDGAGFVGGDMPAFGGNHPLPGAEERVDHDGVGLRAAGQKPDRRVRHAAGGADFLPGGFGKGIQAVARRFFQIGLEQTPQDGRMGPLHIIRGEGKTLKMIHIGCSSVTREFERTPGSGITGTFRRLPAAARSAIHR